MSISTATATTVSALMPDAGVLAGVYARSRDQETWERFSAQGEGCGWCSQPIRLIGSQTTVERSSGEILRSYSTATEADGVLLKACGTRRATRCPSCAATYAADARMLVRSGLSGGKGVPEAVASHPVVFATFTAPSFGAVHRGSDARRCCRPGPRGRRCRHGRALFCGGHHRDGDPAVGEPFCVDCYDYERAVLWNASCSALWHRTTIAIKRELAKRLKVSTRELPSLVRVSFAKVAEYQKRGTVHLHAVIRLDAAGAKCDAPLLDADAGMLAAAIKLAAAKVSAPFPAGFSGRVRWGDQIDVRLITSRTEHGGRDLDHSSGHEKDSASAGARAVANYVAKYATKSTDPAGVLDRRLRGLEDLDARAVSGHLRRMVETAWRLGGRPDLPRLRAWAHTLGFGGHWLTKSRRYSVTFAYLRGERQAWCIDRLRGREVDPPEAVTMSTWEWVGSGWRTRGDTWLAGIGRKARAEARVEAREARCLERMVKDWGIRAPGELANADRVVTGECEPVDWERRL
ncbi:MAG: replication initiator [Acidimicrobiales bacterium]